jgi:hypothetical protein
MSTYNYNVQVYKCATVLAGNMTPLQSPDAQRDYLRATNA